MKNEKLIGQIIEETLNGTLRWKSDIQLTNGSVKFTTIDAEFKQKNKKPITLRLSSTHLSINNDKVPLSSDLFNDLLRIVLIKVIKAVETQVFKELKI